MRGGSQFRPGLVRQIPLLLVLIIACLTLLVPASESNHDTPIIAELIADPRSFSTRTVVVYGVVVDVIEGGTGFVLQNVSQLALVIHGAFGVSAGDQVIVRGVFRADGPELYLSATALETIPSGTG